MTTPRERPPSGKRRWLAVMLATVIMLFSYTMFVYSVVALAGDETIFAGGLLGIAFGLVPGVFVVAAFVSQNEKTFRSALKATGIWTLLAVPIGLVSVPTGLVAGFGAGGVVAFRRVEPQTWQSRSFAVALCVAYTLILQFVSTPLGLFAGAPLPFLAIAVADLYLERGETASP